MWASLSPHPAPPTPLSHLFGFVPRGEGGGPSPVGAEVGGFRARVLLPNHGWAGWVGGGERHTSLSRGVKTLLLFPVALDGLTPLPSIATRTLPVPSLESGLGRVGASPPPLLLGQDLNLVPREGILTPSSQTPVCSLVCVWGKTDPHPGPLPPPVFGARVLAPRTEAGADGGLRGTQPAAVQQQNMHPGRRGGCKEAPAQQESLLGRWRGCCEADYSQLSLAPIGSAVPNAAGPRCRRRLGGHKSGLGAGGRRVRWATRVPPRGHQPARPCHRHR